MAQAVERYCGNMEEKDCWEKFAVSGKVEDYLEYRSCVEYAAHNKADGTRAALVFTTKPEAASAHTAKTGCQVLLHGGLD